MGKILSPSKPKAPQIVYYQQAAASTPTPSSSGTSGTDDGTSPATPAPTEQQVAEERAENILRRNRSRLGTVLTSFKGILSSGNLAASRKTLLGE